MVEQNIDYYHNIENKIEEDIRNYEKMINNIATNLTRDKIKEWFHDLHKVIREVTKTKSILEIEEYYKKLDRDIYLEIEHVIKMIGEYNFTCSEDYDHEPYEYEIEDPTEEELGMLEDLVNIKYALDILYVN